MEKYKEISKEEALSSNYTDVGFLLMDKNTKDIYCLEIEQDCDAENPRDWDNVCTIVSARGNWCIADHHYALNKDELKDWYASNKDRDDLVIKSVYMYDHSGQTISLTDFGDKWDSGCCGFIFVSKKDILMFYPNTANENNWRTVAEEAISKEIEIYDDYIRGNVFRYILSKKETIEHKKINTGETWITTEWEVEDSCGGWYGDPKTSGLIDDVLGDRFIFVKEDI